MSVTRSVVFSIKNFQIVGEQNPTRLLIYDTAKCIAVTKVVTILSQSVEFLIEIMKSDSNILARVLYRDQSTVELIGDVIFPQKEM